MSAYRQDNGKIFFFCFLHVGGHHIFKSHKTNISSNQKSSSIYLSSSQLDSKPFSVITIPFFPTKTESRAGNEGVYLEGHVRLKQVVGSGLHPGRFNFDDTGSVAGTVNVVFSSAVILEEFKEALCNVGSKNARF